MPELPEVETVKETLKKQILNKKIINANIYYDKIIEYPKPSVFKSEIVGQTILDIKRKGKWLLFILNDYILLSHLRMEGKYNIRTKNDPIEKHEHVAIIFDDGQELRYRDTRKFGRMHLIKKEDVFKRKPLNELGLEPWDDELSISYLKQKYERKKLPIKTVILDQSIITGIGNIYADEILFLSKINPLVKASQLSDEKLDAIIKNTKIVLDKAIKLGGTTIRTYTSSDGVHGRFQNELLVHSKLNEKCPNCVDTIIKIKVNGRGTYYCPNCQKEEI